MSRSRELPASIRPMLAKQGKPFDSAEHLFEVKWDGTRAMAFKDSDDCRLLNRHQVDIRDRFPELDFLDRLRPGTVLDGEIVVLQRGKPNFGAILKRLANRAPLRTRALSRSAPATYVVFDLLYDDYRSLMDETLASRREQLSTFVEAFRDPRLVLSEGVVEHGLAYFEEAGRQGLEGIVAKRLGSRYLPGRRTDAWIKIKPRKRIHCAIIGYMPEGNDDFRSLIIAADLDGELECVGRVGSGITEEARARLNRLLRARPSKEPLVSCKIRGSWIGPGLYCTVSYLERTENGELRAPVFEGLCEE